MIRLNHSAFFKAIGACLVVSAIACERAMAPRRNRLAELRTEAANGFGVFHGSVRIEGGPERCHRTSTRVPGVTVELGLWDGIPAFYRDTITKEQPNSLNEPRFQLLAVTTTDANGQFHFLEVPRGLSYAMRVIPPRNSRFEVGYGYTLYGPPTGRDSPDFPILCVKER